MSLPEEKNKPNGQKSQEKMISMLGKIAVFRRMDTEVLKLFAYLARCETYKAGETIIKQNTPCNRLLLLISGEVDICQEHKDRLFHVQTLSSDGLNYFGELALLAQFKWFFCARAATDVELVTISRKAFRKVMEHFPERYATAVDTIVNLRINSFLDQTGYLLDNLREDAWKEPELPAGKNIKQPS